MDSDAAQQLALLMLGGMLGFVANWVLAQSKARHKIREAIAAEKVRQYLCLWPKRRAETSTETLAKRQAEREGLLGWYRDGGGMFLSLNRSGHAQPETG